MRGGAALLLLAFGLAGCARFDEATSSSPPQGFAGYKVAVMPGESMDQLAHRFGTSPHAIIEANHLQPPYALMANQVVIIPPPATYRVKSGDTVAGIATMLGVSEYTLAQANGLSEPYEMRVGQVLRVPGGIGGAPGTDMAEAGPELPVESSMHRSAISASALPPPPGAASGPGSTPSSGPPPSAQAAASPSAAPMAATRSQPARTAVSSPTALAPQQSQRVASATPPSPIAPTPASTPAAGSTPAPPPSTAPSAPAPAAAPTTTAMATPAPMPTHLPAGAPRFITPVKGDIVGHFGPDSSGQKNDGINIAAPAGTPVAAAEAGTVIYAGNELPAFGNLVMVRHAGGWVTAYGHLASISVQRGASVTRGETLGTVGQTGSVSSPQLHFEIRQGSQPVDPTPYLSGKS
ncbi:MAG TPA: peptidoglycan DD-metalloendopeptidase family protein [Alphaproteobacteria bacterium]|nr:peptidoglycan DD-metalloendopeptidase family protein [Alphaproteobacteria bacterium]